jgi:YVTN family beta-propeller protein
MTSFLRLLFRASTVRASTLWVLTASLLGACVCASACAQALTSVPPRGTLISDRGIVLNAAAHKIYAVDQAHGAVVVINSRTGAAKSIATGTHPDAIAVNNATNRIYVVNSGDGNVSVIDGTVDQVTGTIKTDRRPYYIAVNEATNKAYVSNTISTTRFICWGTKIPTSASSTERPARSPASLSEVSMPGHRPSMKEFASYM